MRNHPPGRLNLLVVFLTSALLAACAQPPSNPPRPAEISTPVAPPDPLYHANGGGDPRGSGYWLIWNTCTADNQSATAKTNGGREAGWILLDDLLVDPGIMLGLDEVATCEQATAILRGNPSENSRQNDLPFYRLAAGLLTAQLNLAIPAESCPAAEQAVQAGQILLVSVGYPAKGSALTPKDPERDRQLAELLTGQLEQYNIGELCR